MPDTTTRPHEGIAASLPGYTIESLVFDGDPTRIYRGRRRADGVPVMLKALRGERTAREAAASLRHEFEMTRRLSVPNVIQAYELARHNGFPVVIFEDFGGDSLNNIARQRKLPLDELLRVALQLAKGLGEIHAANIIHKDINPSNVVYNAGTGAVKIIDFGISTYLTREQSAMAGAQVFEGSLPYISPEQTGRMNRSIDYRTDFYSLGVTLYELLTQRPLFIVSEPIEWFHAHIARQPKPPAAIDPTIPQAVSEIVMKLLSKTAEDRYQSARGIYVDLQRCLDELERTGNITPFELGNQDTPDRFQLPQRLYGRETQVRELLMSFDRVSRGACELALVSGRSGIGKTSLIREIYKPVTERRGYFVTGKYDQLHRDVPYSALTKALRELVRQLFTESEERLARWRSKIRRALGPNAQLMVDLIRELELIIGPQPNIPELPPMEAEQRFHQVFHNFIRVFCAVEHPLAIFLDDLQWADAASLTLLDLLTTTSRSPYLFIIGAYRDNELHAGHPLADALQDMRARGAAIQEIRLDPLAQPDITELLADALSAPAEQVGELAELVEQKTAGNPFFTEEFLKSLHRAELIRFSMESGSWQWDIEQIHAQQITDNVVDLMAERLRRLAPETRQLLELGACIGNRFALGVLAVVSEQPPALVAQHLRPGITDGLVAPIGDAYQLLELEQTPVAMDLTVEFAFAHDRIQQAAYSLLDDARRKQTHLRIGRLLLQRFQPGQWEERLFEITNHLNLGLDVMDNVEERAQLCRLNLAAGKRAKTSSAYREALNYFMTALSLLSEDAWSNDYTNTLDLYAEAAEAAYLSGEDEATERYLEVGLAGARSLTDKVKLYRVQISACIARGEPRKAVDIALPVLAQLGHRYPRKPKQHHIVRKLLKVLWLLRGKTMDDLRALPEMTDPLHLAAMSIGERLGRAAMFVEPNLLSLMVLQGVQVSLRHGYTAASLTAYGAFGMILATHLGNPVRGLEFGQLALELTQRLNAKTVEGRVLHVYNALVRHWQEPLANTFDDLEKAYRQCLEMGDFEYAALAAVVRSSHRFVASIDLERWKAEVEAYHAAVKPLKQEAMLDFLACYRQSAENLMGYAEDPARLRGPYYDVEAMLPQHLASGDEALIFNNLRVQADFHYQFGNYAEALTYSQRANQFRGGTDGFYHAVRNNLHDSLIHLANLPKATKRQRRRFLRHVAGNQRVLRKWAAANPSNTLNKLKLVEAEILRQKGRDMEAQAFYDAAIQLAREQGFTSEEALAHELCGRMHMEAGRRAIGEPYLTRAYQLYLNWGATAVTDHLRREFPSIAEPAPESRGTQTFMTPMTTVDVTSLMKALRAIVDEKVHARMVEKVISTAVEFAGAQRGLLLLGNTQGELRIEGEVDIDRATSRILQSLSVTGDSVPEAVINYVSRTGSSVVIHDAQRLNGDIPGLHLDPYIQRVGVRSILCLPILSGMDDGQKMIGILYLENNRATGTFTSQRFDTLEIICIAAAGRLELSRRAAIDGLTGLYNHDSFQTLLRQEFATAREQGRPLALILIDIDQFKRFNDTWGHQLGDRVLREVAQLIKSASRSGDAVARYGGEEMAVILPNASAAAAESVAERIRIAVEQHVIVHGDSQLQVTISLGLASLIPSIPDPDALIRHADAALYRSKANGRNRLTVA